MTDRDTFRLSRPALIVRTPRCVRPGFVLAFAGLLAVGCGAENDDPPSRGDSFATGDDANADGPSASSGSSGGDGDDGPNPAGDDTNPADDGSDGGSDDAIPTGDGSDDTTGGPVDPGDWLPPIGIPAPDFGITQIAQDCDACTVISTSDPSTLQDIPAGTVVELHGGPFSGSSLTISGNGTAQAPIFVRSQDPENPVVLSFDTAIEGSYLIVESIDFDQGLLDHNVTIEGDHIALRHSQAHAFRPGHFSTTVVVSNANHIVLYNNEIFDNGDFNVAGEHDVHGVGGGNFEDLWIVDNHLHHNRGDSMQFGHQAGNSLGNIYIGRNDVHDDGENCVDIKEASNVVVSQNDLHDPVSGIAVVFHDCPLNAAAIYNEIHDADVGVSLPSLHSACDAYTPIELFVTRNTFCDAQTGVQGWGSGKRYMVAGNTFSGVAATIDVDNEGPGSVLSDDDSQLQTVFTAFEAVYGIDISD